MGSIAPLSSAVPDAQRAHVFKSHGDPIEYATVKVPSWAPDEILVKVKFSGVCHTDLHAWKGDLPIQAKEHLVGGHEGTGIVAAVGEDVTDIKIGDRVGVQWINRSCGTCEFCVIGNEPLCPKVQLSGYTVDGTFQEYCVCKGANAVRIPDGIPLDKAAPILCAGVTVYKAIKEINGKAGQIIAIVGAGGGLGSLACQYAKACGFKVLAISAGAAKRAMCLEELGVEYFIDYKSSVDLTTEVKKVTNGGPHASVVVAAAKEPFNQAIQYVRAGGTVVAVGLPPGEIQADIATIVCREIKLKGSYVGNRHDTEEALRLYTSARFKLPLKLLDFEELPRVYELMEKGEIQGRTVLKATEEKKQWKPILTVQPKFRPECFNLGTILAYRLEELGVKDYFTVPGDFNLDLLDELLKNKSLRQIGCCNELNAGYAADGYARSAPGKVAVVVVTFMVGGLSVINAIAGAYSEGLKVIVISGCPPQDTFGQNKLIHHTLGIKDRDQALRMFRDVTTTSTRLTTKGDPLKSLDHAISSCLHDSLPVYIEIPSDIAQVPITSEAPPPLTLMEHPGGQPSDTLDAANTILASWKVARNPILVVGARTRHTIPQSTLMAVIDKLGCAVFVQPDAKSLVPESHPQFRGTFWSSASEPICEKAVLNSDLWLTVGCRWTDYHTLGKCLDISRESCRILNLQGSHIIAPDGKFVEGLCLNDVLQALIGFDIPSNDTTLYPAKTTQAHGVTNPVDHSVLSVSAVLQGIQSILKPGDTLIADTGDSWFNAQTIQLPDSVDFQMQMVYGSIGWSLPATLGYQVGKPDGRVITMIGDGSFQMTAQELSTMIQARTNSVIFIFNNLGYAIETAIHDGPYNYYTNWNYTSFATSLYNMFHASFTNNSFVHPDLPANSTKPPLFAMQIKTTTDLRLALDRVRREPDTLAVLECCVHPDDISPSLRRFGSAVRGRTADEPSENDIVYKN